MKAILKTSVPLTFFFLVLVAIPIQSKSQSGIQCVWCKGFNGNHNTGCPYLAKTSNTKSSASSGINFQQEIMQSIFTNLFNSLLNSGKNQKQSEEAKRIQQQQEQLNQQRMAFLLAQQKKYNDSVAQAKHNAMMKEYKKMDGNGELKYKGLDDKKWNASVYFNCKITSFKGDVFIIKLDGKRNRLTEDHPIDLAPGDYIVTGPNSQLKMHYALEKGGEDILMGQKSVVSVVTDENGMNVPELMHGRIYSINNLVEEKAKEVYDKVTGEAENQLNAIKNKVNKKFEMRTPSCALAVRGTEFTVEVDSMKNSIVIVHEGVVDIANKSGKNKITLTSATKAFINPEGEMIGPFMIKEPEWEKWWEK